MNINDPLVEARYATWLNQSVAYISPQYLEIVGGRGTSKTTQIHAERFQGAVLEMPRSLQMFLCNTYENARTNLVPSLTTGWTEFRDWKKGIDFVVGEPPPSYFEKPWTEVENYKNLITHRNGATIVVGSAAQISGLAGNSYQYLGVDEAKYISKDVMDTIEPALRGYNKFPTSAYCYGHTFTTDYPSAGKGDEAWILERMKNTDTEMARLAFYCGYHYYQNEYQIAKALKFRDQTKVKRLVRKRARLYERWFIVRKKLSFFLYVSSFANIHALGIEPIEKLMTSLGVEGFKERVLSIRSGVEAGQRFYGGLEEKHFYRDGENEEYSTNLGLKGDPSCLVLKYLRRDQELDGGLDFGNMISLVVAQEQGEYLRCMKNIYKLGKNNTREMADHFIRFFKPHKNKVLNLYYDRSGNQYEKIGRDWASDVKKSIERDKNGATGWKVRLMNREQATITQSDEHLFMKKVFEENTEGLPKVLIDAVFCRELKSSLELAKIEVKKNAKGQKKIYKDKSSEKLPLSQLPMNSTNFSDAFKYLLYRKAWAKVAKGRGGLLGASYETL
ncbi:hypothetical protein [Altibacter sp. HG106]|uniref:hypothetical protein n=1 Tax=Altibacter sp. HG106 TaxID=3023937 RepID=UPI002350633E|nr:hypothetical protein [Altibacter sp. HG106]MDC7994461.1 hypothetical protein [Altibacter sp. HG106]